MKQLVPLGSFLVIVFFILIPSCGRRKDLNGSASNASYMTDTSANCLNLQSILDTIKGKVFRIYLKDTFFYKEVKTSDGPPLYTLNEKRLPDGYMLFFKSETDQNPTIIEHVMNKKKNGLFIYYNSSDLHIQVTYYKNDELDGLYFQYETPCVLRYKSKYQKGKLRDTSWAYTKTNTVSFYQVYDSLGFEKEQVNFSDYPTIKDLHVKRFRDSILYVQDSTFDLNGRLKEVNRFFKKQNLPTVVQTKHVFKGGKVVRIDTLSW
jgi:hypothetical protein